VWAVRSLRSPDSLPSASRPSGRPQPQALGGVSGPVGKAWTVVTIVSLLVAVASAFLASAPFTPSIVAVVVTLPIGVFGVFAGRWRTGCLTIYWSLTALVAFFTLVNSSQIGDTVLLLAYAVGLCLSAALVFSFFSEFKRDAKLS